MIVLHLKIHFFQGKALKSHLCGFRFYPSNSFSAVKKRRLDKSPAIALCCRFPVQGSFFPEVLRTDRLPDHLLGQLRLSVIFLQNSGRNGEYQNKWLTWLQIPAQPLGFITEIFLVFSVLLLGTFHSRGSLGREIRQEFTWDLDSEPWVLPLMQ